MYIVLHLLFWITADTHMHTHTHTQHTLNMIYYGLLISMYVLIGYLLGEGGRGQATNCLIMDKEGGGDTREPIGLYCRSYLMVLRV